MLGGLAYTGVPVRSFPHFLVLSRVWSVSVLATVLQQHANISFTAKLLHLSPCGLVTDTCTPRLPPPPPLTLLVSF